MRKSSVTENMVKIVEDSLTDEELNEADHKMINQFLRATKLDVDRAVKRLKATIAWRIQEQPHRRVCAKCSQKPRSHYLHLVSTDLYF